ncbi:hypothetical protein BpHYR1_026996 [Brachionus plicatilis]|uniref:Uncharacterized protein n=1 Tax=Brachionus plicatilis TaxID=10195 RepID=A0A3M7SPN7_BRAPC|nr:hypothetical protein BpHYR1_026996 [Brachionus plicatilis]
MQQAFVCSQKLRPVVDNSLTSCCQMDTAASVASHFCPCSKSAIAIRTLSLAKLTCCVTCRSIRFEERVRERVRFGSRGSECRSSGHNWPNERVECATKSEVCERHGREERTAANLWIVWYRIL